MKKNKVVLGVFLFMIYTINISAQNNENKLGNKETWQVAFDNQLPMFGHRNWILVVDKAFPMQNAQGITTIYASSDLLTVLSYVTNSVNSSTHVKPIYYTDKELSYLSTDLVPNINQYKHKLDKILAFDKVNVILHDSIFAKMAKASSKFEVLVIKTNETIPYSSVFIELDCKYWTVDKEQILRKKIKP